MMFPAARCSRALRTDTTAHPGYGVAHEFTPILLFHTANLCLLTPVVSERTIGSLRQDWIDPWEETMGKET